MSIQALDGPQSILNEWIVLFKGFHVFRTHSGPQQLRSQALDGPQTVSVRERFFVFSVDK